MTTGDIESHMKEFYEMDISDSTVSRITDKILPSSSHVRSEGRIVKRAVYIALDMDMNGKKDVLVIACVDGLTGFPQAIEAVYTQTEIQQCIIRQIRNSMKFVSYKDIKKLMSDLKRLYAAPTEESALNEIPCIIQTGAEPENRLCPLVTIHKFYNSKFTILLNSDFSFACQKHLSKRRYLQNTSHHIHQNTSILFSS